MKFFSALPIAALLAASTAVNAIPVQDTNSLNSLVARIEKYANTPKEIKEFVEKGKEKKTTLNGHEGWRLSENFFLYKEGNHWRALDVFKWSENKWIATAHIAGQYRSLEAGAASKKQAYIEATSEEDAMHREWSGNHNHPPIKEILKHLKFEDPPEWNEERDGILTHEEFMPAKLKPAGVPDKERDIKGAFVPKKDQNYQGRTIQSNNAYVRKVKEALEIKSEILRLEYQEDVPDSSEFKKLFDYYKKSQFEYDDKSHIKNIERYKPLKIS